MAEDRLATLHTGPAAHQVSAAQAAVDTARSALATAQAKRAELAARPTAAELRDAEDRVALAQASVTRARAESAGSNGGVDTSSFEYALQQKSIEDDRTRVERLEQLLADTRVRAPFDGVVTAVHVGAGDPLLSGQPAVTVAPDGAPMVVADALDREAGKLAIGQTATVQVDGIDGKVEGRVSHVADSANGIGKVAYVQVDWPSTPPLGAQVKLAVSLSRLEDALLIPEKAVRSNGSRKYVEYMEGTSRRIADVDIGIVSGGFAEVERGLIEGQTVLVRP